VIQESKDSRLQKMNVTNQFVKGYYDDLLKASKDVAPLNRQTYLVEQVKTHNNLFIN
jgi:hypothetical protein